MDNLSEFSAPQDEEEDVPSDFFDDFLSNDFMDGLDVVDAWDDENDLKVNKASDRLCRSTSRNRRRRYSRSRSPIRPKSREYYRDRSPRGGRFRSRRSRERGHVERPRGRNSSLQHKVNEELNPDHRRDPEKTKRDIQKDKDKCAKKQEDRIISEKLKVVETGLVPPGTEMDADLESLKPDRKTELIEKHASKKRVSDKRISPKRDKSSNHKRQKKSSRSPYRPRSRSKLSKLSRRSSVEYKRYDDTRSSKTSGTNYNRKSLDKEIRQKSPASDREMWMRHQENRVVVNDFFENQHLKPRKDFQDYSSNFGAPNRSSYYNPMQERISDCSQHYNMVQPVPMPVPVPVPAPVAPPIQYFPQMSISSEQNYDQNFFIGQQYSELYPTHTPYQSATPFINCVPNSNVVTVPIIESNQPENTSPVKNSDSLKTDIEKEKETINKLFEEKQISLSDFLSVSAKHADPSKPVNVQRKIKVISLCQDAIKSLAGNSQLNGRFFLKKVHKDVEKPADTKFQSPLRKTPFIRFAFTTPTKVGEQPSTLQNSLNKLLASLGLLEDSDSVFVKPTAPIEEDSSSASVQATPTKWPTISNKGGDSVFEIAPRKAKMCQTDFAKCQICAIRKARTFVDKEVQCDVTYSSSSTQVSDDDFMRPGAKTPFRDTLKNQSIAHLTPAQLMRQTLNQTEPKQSNNFIQQRGLSDVSPENPNNYRGDNSSDFSRGCKPSPNYSNKQFQNKGNNNFDVRPHFGNNRPNMYDNRNNNPPNVNNNAAVRGNTAMRASDFFEGGRQNYNNPRPQHPMQQQPNKRPLLPNPNFNRSF